MNGVYINSAKDRQGFFGVLGSNGTIKKLGVVASHIKGKSCIGGLVGETRDGMISGSYSTGKVKGEEYVGELVGKGNKAVDSYYGNEKK